MIFGYIKFYLSSPVLVSSIGTICSLEFLRQKLFFFNQVIHIKLFCCELVNVPFALCRFSVKMKLFIFCINVSDKIYLYGQIFHPLCAHWAQCCTFSVRDHNLGEPRTGLRYHRENNNHLQGDCSCKSLGDVQQLHCTEYLFESGSKLSRDQAVPLSSSNIFL